MTKLVNHFDFIEKLGEGSFGSVWRCKDKNTGELMALKMMKRRYYTEEDCLNHPEVRSMWTLSSHPNILGLREVIREGYNLFLVFESMESDLFKLMNKRSSKTGELFSEDEVRSYAFQLLLGLAHLHQHGYFHRDLKPENVLVSRSGELVKIGDFGMAHKVSVSGETPYTHCVTTRWYRAPEVLLCSSYTPAIDMWAMGAIMAELFTFAPTFPGRDELDQIYQICEVIGSPNEKSWADGLRRAQAVNFKFPEFDGCGFASKIPFASEEAIDLISRLCSWDPYTRPTAAEALQHPFFASCFRIPPSVATVAAKKEEEIAVEKVIQRLVDTLSLKHKGDNSLLNF